MKFESKNLFHDPEAGFLTNLTINLAIFFSICISAYVSEFCKTNSVAVVGSSGNCAQYIDCARQREGYVMECRYPDLFSASNHRCQAFTKVDCEGIVEPQAPCMFLKILKTVFFCMNHVFYLLPLYILSYIFIYWFVNEFLHG